MGGVTEFEPTKRVWVGVEGKLNKNRIKLATPSLIVRFSPMAWLMYENVEYIHWRGRLTNGRERERGRVGLGSGKEEG